MQMTSNEELKLNILSLYTNISYYSDINNKNTIIYNDRINICDTIINYLVDDNEEIMFESARTIGNLSRFDDVKDFLISKNIIQILCVLLQHTIRGIAYNL